MRGFASPVPTGLGMARTEHGIMPIPSPVVLELLQGVPTYSRGIPVELAQPFARIDVGGGHSEVVGAAGPSLAVAVGLALRQPGDKNE